MGTGRRAPPPVGGLSRRWEAGERPDAPGNHAGARRNLGRPSPKMRKGRAAASPKRNSAPACREAAVKKEDRPANTGRLT